MKDVITDAYGKADLVKILKDIGIKQSMILEVHGALSTFGYVIGGAQTVVDALLEVLGYNGTLIMAMQCGDNSEPANFMFPPLAHALMAKYRHTYPHFDPLNSETRGMGAILDNFRRRRGVVFSRHPSLAFAAYGRYAKMLTNYQDLDFSLGDTSPLGRLFELKAHCLLIGVDYDNMTSLHLAEYRSAVRGVMINGAAVDNGGFSSWQKYLDIDLDSDDGFIDIGRRLEEKGLVNIKEINDKKIRLLRIDSAVIEGVKYYKERMRRYE